MLLFLITSDILFRIVRRRLTQCSDAFVMPTTRWERRPADRRSFTINAWMLGWIMRQLPRSTQNLYFLKVPTKNSSRRKRRNFSKEAREILQDYYDAHNDHPYPSDEDKQALADRCGISVQQVSVYFSFDLRFEYEASFVHILNNCPFRCLTGSATDAFDRRNPFKLRRWPTNSLLPTIRQWYPVGVTWRRWMI